jgi:hypothetical protein
MSHYSQHGIFIRNMDFRELVKRYKEKFPNDINVNQVYKELFEQDLKSHFIIAYSLISSCKGTHLSNRIQF